jgi:hypothetical protein
MEITPTSREIIIENNKYNPKGKENIKRLLPEGILYTTSNIKRRKAQTGKKAFQSTFLKRKKNTIKKILRPKRANNKLSKYTSPNTPNTVKRMFSVIFKYLF